MAEDIIRRTQEMIDVMQAFVRGETIEIYTIVSHTWQEVGRPSWNWAQCQYRIKPKPKTVWITNFDGVEEIHDTEPCSSKEIKVTKFMEVIEEGNK